MLSICLVASSTWRKMIWPIIFHHTHRSVTIMEINVVLKSDCTQHQINFRCSLILVDADVLFTTNMSKQGSNSTKTTSKCVTWPKTKRTIFTKCSSTWQKVPFVRCFHSWKKFHPSHCNKQDAIIEIECRSDHAVELIQGALIDIEGKKRELNIILGMIWTIRKFRIVGIMGERKKWKWGLPIIRINPPCTALRRYVGSSE